MVKLFSNFDTKAPTKNYAEAVQEYGFDKVMFVRRYKVYLWVYVFVPGFFGILFALGAILPVLREGRMDTMNRVLFGAMQAASGLIAIVLLRYAIMKYYNYILDYTIITPDYVAEYNQHGFLRRHITTIEIDKIKTINFSSGGLLGSLFNFGKVEILLEGDEGGRGDLTISFVFNPEGVKYKIIEMMDTKKSARGTARIGN